MSLFAKIQDGAVVRYPYTLADLAADHPCTSFPEIISPTTLAEFGVMEVVQAGPPAHDALTQTAEEAPPVLSDGVWTQAWTLRAATATERDARAAALQRRMTDAVQGHLDAVAQAHGYDGILSLASYASSVHPPFSTEGRAGADWRDAVWLHCFGVLAEVQAGRQSIPTPEALIDELPVMMWPG